MYIREFVHLHNLRAKGVLHVGAHKGEEVEEYLANGLAAESKIIWVEAQPKLANELTSSLDPEFNKVYCGVAWDKSGEKLTFNVTSKSASSSVFNLAEHKKLYPDITVIDQINVTTVRLEELIDQNDNFEFVVLDIQGAEHRALQGLGNRLGQVNWIYTEVSKIELYEGATLFEELEAQLNKQGFIRVFTAWDRRAGWGDALYARKSIYEISTIQRVKIQFSKARRAIRSYIPNSAFPFLVNCKKLIKKLS